MRPVRPSHHPDHLQDPLVDIMKIRPANSEDLGAIIALLRENALPASDITAGLLSEFLVAEDTDGALVGSVAVERFGSTGLLRSLAVRPPARSSGLGSSLLSHAQTQARERGVRQLWLLTTTAAGFFKVKGYVAENRSAAAPEMQASAQFAELCPSTAICISKTLAVTTHHARNDRG